MKKEEMITSAMYLPIEVRKGTYWTGAYYILRPSEGSPLKCPSGGNHILYQINKSPPLISWQISMQTKGGPGPGGAWHQHLALKGSLYQMMTRTIYLWAVSVHLKLPEPYVSLGWEWITLNKWNFLGLLQCSHPNWWVWNFPFLL